VTSGGEGAIFQVVELSTAGKDRSAASGGMHEENAGQERTGIPAQEAKTATPTEDRDIDTEEADKHKKTEEEKRAAKPKDPIRMFGILTPQALRLAQGGAIKMVEEIIPKLVSIDAEMKEVEIKIRRARKHRAKVEAAEKTVVGEGRKEGVVS
jgi:coiled-coil domain-containing protein 115